MKKIDEHNAHLEHLLDQLPWGVAIFYQKNVSDQQLDPPPLGHLYQEPPGEPKDYWLRYHENATSHSLGYDHYRQTYAYVGEKEGYHPGLPHLRRSVPQNADYLGSGTPSGQPRMVLQIKLAPLKS